MIKRSLFVILVSVSVAVFGGNPLRTLINSAGDAKTFPGENMVMVFDSTRVNVEESGLSHVVEHKLYKVLTAKGALDISVVKYGYDPLSAYAEIRKVVIYRKDGSEIALDVSKTLDYPAPARAIYWGAREKMIEVGRLEPGDALETVIYRKGFTYALLAGDEDDKYIPPMKGHFYDIMNFYDSYPVKQKVYQVEIPKDKTLQYQVYNGEVQSSCWQEAGKLVYTFSKKDFLPFHGEPRMVALSDVAPKLLLSTSPDWYAKSRWFFKVNEDYGSFAATPEIHAKVNEILKGAENELDSISRLTHWCADEIRYSGISMGPGEGFTLHSGAMTFNDRCGVCKDKAGMLITMLRAAGFESYPAMTMAGSRIDYIPADQFNHCVTVIKRHNGKYQLLDPTWVPFIRELWSSAEQQQQYLMGVPEGADLGTTALSPPDNHYIRITGNSELMTDGTLKGEISITAEGQSDASVRGLFKYSGKAFWDLNVEKEILKISPNAVINKIEYTDPVDYISSPVRVTIGYSIPQYAVKSGETLIFTPVSATPAFKSFQPQLSFETNAKEKKYPFRDRCSRNIEITETIILPPVKTIYRLPEPIEKTGDAASFNGGYELRGNTLVYHVKADFRKRIYDAADWPSFRDAVDAQNSFAEHPVILELQ